MTNEQMERKMEFIVDTLARVAVNDEKDDIRLSQLERIAKLMVSEGRCERRARSEGDERLTEADERLKHAMADLADAQKRTEESIAHTDKHLDALIDIVRQRQNGRSNN